MKGVDSNQNYSYSSNSIRVCVASVSAIVSRGQTLESLASRDYVSAERYADRSRVIRT